MKPKITMGCRVESLLTTKQAAEILGIAEVTLRTARSRGQIEGRIWLPFVRVGRAIRYRRIDILVFIEQNLVIEEDRG